VREPAPPGPGEGRDSAPQRAEESGPRSPAEADRAALPLSLRLEALSDEELHALLDACRREELGRMSRQGEDADPRRSQFLMQSEKLASLGVLARGLAHEFNNLFTGIMANCDYALRSGDDAAQKKALEVALAGCRRASVIVKNLQSFARQTRSRIALADLVEICARTVQLLQPNLKVKKIKVEKDFGLVPAFLMDAPAIQQLVLNLLTNAMQAIPGPGTILCRVAREGNEAILEVKDSGCGIAPDVLRHLFEPFFSTKGVYARTESERQVPGTGLGLAVSHGIVRQHGGTIEVESELGKGATFRVRLPLRTGPETVPAG
jgi:two-component system NtrC family sensor kinase